MRIDGDDHCCLDQAGCLQVLDVQHRATCNARVIRMSPWLVAWLCNIGVKVLLML